MEISLGFWLALFLLGLSLGSFFNVVVCRLNQDDSPLRGRSRCPHCRKTIRWFDNIPLFSFFLLKGKCRDCKEEISWQYPLVEFATAVLTLGLYLLLIVNYQLPMTNYLFSLLVSYCLLIIFVSDWRFMIVPDEVLMVLGIAGLIFFAFFSPTSLSTRFLTGFLSSLFFLLLFLSTKGKGMGLGDVKLAFLIGFILSFPACLWAFFMAFLTGALVGVILILLNGKHLKSQIAFGPFLVFCTWVVFLWQDKINNFFLSILWP